MGTFLRNQLVGEFSTKDFTEKLLLLGRFEVILQFGKKIVEEFIGIHLLTGVHRPTVIVLFTQGMSVSFFCPPGFPVCLKNVQQTLYAAQKSEVS